MQMMTYRLGGKSGRRAFTLVELLVVIGIIAVLIGILLPVLSSARKSAQATKCAAALREIGNAFKMYAIDNNQFYPPMRVAYIAANPYKVMFGNEQYQPVNGAQTYWMYFLAKYVSKQKFGVSAGMTPEEVSRAINSVLWGCPNFVPVTTANTTIGVGGIALTYTGYGYNGFPEYSATYPDPATSSDPYDALGDSVSYKPPDPRAKCVSFITAPTNNGDWSQYYTVAGSGKWYKMGNYTNAAERALVGDCRAYVLEALKASGPNNFSGQGNINILSTTFWTSNTQSPDTGQSSYDYYRHGKYPPMEFPNAFNSKGGKISYNLLYADGHVENLQSREQGFKAARMRFPG
jgi:prepilin-type N-terminal cleavage/methylation domain-containing protein/prepilin-type processing-associated H-X9-DG protein